MGRPRMPLQERLDLYSIPEPNSGCTLWLGSITPRGYGAFVVTIGELGNGVKKFKGPHVVAYELKNGPVPDGLVIDHKCRNTICINADHLEAVTQRENILRGEGLAAKNARKQVCSNGHALTVENVLPVRKGNHLGRECRECKRIAKRERRARERQA